MGFFSGAAAVLSENDQLVHCERETRKNADPAAKKTDRRVSETKASLTANRLVFAEHQLVNAAEDFFNLNRRGEEAVAGKYSTGNHLAFGAKAAERKNRRVFERGIAADCALDVELARAGSIDEDEIRLKPARGVERQIIVVLFAD